MRILSISLIKEMSEPEEPKNPCKVCCLMSSASDKMSRTKEKALNLQSLMVPSTKPKEALHSLWC
jgi:hypothetical protein